ncbi:MAG: succinylglutamate desuccinylase/aspartoacylase family protein [Treponema sp.]|jgi:predicted deacylase|nr:succinylglutamate desuccinylase/aspartoacylase family protein [Treponema sp.]
MVKTIVSEELPVGEKFEIRKNIISGGTSGKRFCVVTGAHGDELEGQYVCFELARRLNQHIERLNGNVEIYPALNPLGVDSITRGFPGFDLDMNRIFPGEVNGHLIENTAYKIIQDLRGADMALDIHSSNIFLREAMQARVNIQTAGTLLPFAKMLNTDFIWIHDAATVLQSTLAHSLNEAGTKTLVVEMGIGMRITREYGDRLVDGIFNVLARMGMWTGDIGETSATIKEPIVSSGGEVFFMNAETSGIIIPEASHSSYVEKGERLCQIVEPFEGKVLQDVLSPVDGFLFTMRTFPIVYEGSLIARIYKHGAEEAEQ